MSESGPGSVAKGLLFTFLLHFLQVLVAPAVFFLSLWLIPSKNNQYAGLSFMLAINGVGITQLVYMIPAVSRFRKFGELKTVQGLLIGAAVTFLLCAACDGLLFLPKR